MAVVSEKVKNVCADHSGFRSDIVNLTKRIDGSEDNMQRMCENIDRQLHGVRGEVSKLKYWVMATLLTILLAFAGIVVANGGV